MHRNPKKYYREATVHDENDAWRIPGHHFKATLETLLLKPSGVHLSVGELTDPQRLVSENPECLDQGWQTTQPIVCVLVKVLLAHGHIHSFTYCLWLLSSHKCRAETAQPAKPKIFQPFRKSDDIWFRLLAQGWQCEQPQEDWFWE